MFRIGTNEFFIPLDRKIDSKNELNRINNELNHLEGFLNSILNKLSNSQFVKNAPNAVINLERKKASDTKEKIKNLKSRLKNIK